MDDNKTEPTLAELAAMIVPALPLAKAYPSLVNAPKHAGVTKSKSKKRNKKAEKKANKSRKTNRK